jgi:hypothetical protein
MACVAEAFIDTAELTRGQRGILTTLAAADYVDQLSRFERRSSTDSWRAKPVDHERKYSSRGRILTLRWKDFGQPLPVWFDPVMQGFADLVTLEPKWDSYQAKPIQKVAIDKAMALLDALLRPSSPTPSIVPLSSGGLQVEWHRNDQDLEIVFEPRKTPEFFYKNASTGAEEDGSVSSRVDFVIQLIRALE